MRESLGPERRKKDLVPRTREGHEHPKFLDAVSKSGRLGEFIEDLRREDKEFWDMVRGKPELVHQGAIEQAKKGGDSFRRFVRLCEDEHVPDIENLINNEEVIQAILDESVSRAQKGPTSYGWYIDEWTSPESGFERKKADGNPALHELIREEYFKRAKKSAESAESYLKEWKGAGIRDIEKIVEVP